MRTAPAHPVAPDAVQPIFRALADPRRRSILEALTEGEAAVKELTARFDVSQPAVSQHLAALRQAGLVHSRRSGRSVFYEVDRSGMRPLVDWLAHYQVFWPEHLGRLERLLDESKASP